MDSNWRKNVLTITVVVVAAAVTLGAWFIADKSVFNMAMGSWFTALGAFINYYFGASHKRNTGTDAGTDDNVEK